ncbi:single-stranded DNA-binding protein [Patescibacteria group bacterium]|nr:single-stranded DNA-binding protein [Patescibacteria group bacterium]
MRSVNKVILVGNVTRDPQMKVTSNGQQMTTFGIATNRQWTTQDGGNHNSAEYHDVVAWSRLAELCEKYIKKGKFIYIEGYLKTRTWDDEQGAKRFRTEVVIQDMIMLNKRGDGSESEEMEPELVFERSDDMSNMLPDSDDIL